MDLICIATDDGRTYYSILSRLKLTGLAFKSCTPSEVVHHRCGLILTTMRELETIGNHAVPIEDLDENPAVLKGQLVSLLKVGKRELLIGIDPGSRMGVAVFYQNTKLTSSTLGSVAQLMGLLRRMVRTVSYSKVVVKVGDGSPKLSMSVARSVRSSLPDAIIEIVDERGTSNRTRWKDLSGDQLAAARIAYRKGAPF